MLANRRLHIRAFYAFQLLLMVIGALFCALWGADYAISFVYGALLMFVANAIFLLRIFMRKARFSALKEVGILYLCEFFKLLTVAIGTVLIAMYLHPKLFPYIFGLIVLQAVIWFMPLFTRITR